MFIFEKQTEDIIENTNFLDKENVLSESYVDLLKCIKQINTNMFISNESKQSMFDLYCINRRKNYILEKFVKKKKFNRNNKLLNESNLYFTENIDEIDDNKKIKIYDNLNFYIFEIEELLKLIDTSLCGFYNIYPEPKIPKNPYTNLEFNNLQLNKIYHSCLEKGKMSIWLSLYFNSEFDINKFENDNYRLLQNNAIKLFFHDISNESLHENLYRLLTDLGIQQYFKKFYAYSREKIFDRHPDIKNKILPLIIIVSIQLKMLLNIKLR